jgi:hypothetical protein
LRKVTLKAAPPELAADLKLQLVEKGLIKAKELDS